MTKVNDSSEVHDWLVERLASALKVDKGDLHPDTPFSQFALDSLDAVTLVMDLELHLGMELPPTLLWDHPTVRKCVSYLVAEHQGAMRLPNAGT